MCTNQHCCGKKPLTNLRYYKNRYIFLAAYLAVTVGLLFTCLFPLTHSFSCLQVSLVLKTIIHSMGRFQVTLLVVCSPVHRLGKSFSKACFPHMKQEVDLDQTFPIHNNSTVCRVKGGDFEIVHKNLATPWELCQVNIQQGSILLNGHFFDLAWSFCCI